MKTTMKKLIRYAFSTAALLCAFACVSCSGLFDSSSKNTSAETGTAVFSIASSTSTETASASTRTAAPAAGTVMAQVTSWTLANGDTTYSGTADTAAETVTFTGVPWNQALSVTLSGVNSSNTVIVTATKTITLTSSANTTSVMLEPVAASGTGEVAITITVSDGLTLDGQTPYVYLIPVGSGSTTSISGTAGTADATTGSVPYTFTGSSVSAGLYQVCVGFNETYSADDSYTFMSDDYLAVYAGCTSTASYDSSSIYDLNEPSVTYFVSSSGTGTGSLSSPLSLAGAITKINASTTSLKFRLLDNITYSGTDSITNKCTIDLGGHTLTVSGITSSAFVNLNLTTGVTVTFENGTIKNNAEQTSPLFNIASSNTLSLTDITVSGMEKSTDNVYAPIESVGAVNLTNADIENGDCSYAFYAGSASGTLYIYDAATTFDGTVKANSIQYDVTPTKGFTVEPASISTSAVTLFTAKSGVSIDTSLFPLWDTTKYYYTSSGTIMPVQELTWSSGATANVSYAGTSKDAYNSNTVSDGCMCTAIDQNGQIYVLYYNSSSSYFIYSAGTTYSTSGISSIGSICALNDGNGSLLLSTNAALYELTLSGTTYTATPITLSDDTSPTITSMAAVSASGTQYVYYAYTATGTPDVPTIACAVLANQKLTKSWSKSVTLTDGGAFSTNVIIKDMTISYDGDLYLILNDVYDGFCFMVNDAFYYTERGALVNAGAVSSLETSTEPTITFTSYGWRSSANGTIYNVLSGYSSYSVSLFASSNSSYTDDQYLVGPIRFLAVTPKKITLADYGNYVVIPSDTGTSYYKRKRGTAVFTLSERNFAVSDESTTGLYGEDGSDTAISSVSTY